MIPGLGRSPGVGNGHLFRYSFLDNPMDRGAWLTTVYGAAESDTTELTLLVNQWESPAWSPRRHGCAGAKTGLVKGHGEGASKDHSGQGRRASPEMISHVLSRCWGWASGGCAGLAGQGGCSAEQQPALWEPRLQVFRILSPTQTSPPCSCSPPVFILGFLRQSGSLVWLLPSVLWCLPTLLV